jgi:hypothetical protein
MADSAAYDISATSTSASSLGGMSLGGFGGINTGTQGGVDTKTLLILGGVVLVALFLMRRR